MKQKKPMNIVIMLADQLRADCVGCYGNSIIKTPNCDRLAAEGTRFENAFAQHPQCVPSRAAVLTGRYPHVNGAISNHCAMGNHELTIGEYLQQYDYRSIGVGKLHIYSEKEKTGFTETMLCGGQQSDAVTPEVLREDYKKWLRENGYWQDAIKAYEIHNTKEYWENFRANVNPMPSEAYIDTWVGDQAVEYIKKQNPNQPFFMFVGFPNPHIPFDAPEPYASMYDPATVPLPDTFEMDLSNKPPQHAAYRRRGRKENYEKLDESRLRKVISLYYGSITLVDDQVGKVLNALEEQHLMENTIVVFVSDHGELLGHYGMLIKSIDAYPMLYDVGIRVPLIIRAPRDNSRAPGSNAGNVVREQVELIDLYSTVLESASIEIPPQVQGQSLRECLFGGPAPKRTYVFSESGAVKTIRGERYKLVYYPGQPYGELYDIIKDPIERNNLYDNDEYRETRDVMIVDLLDRLIYTEAPLHGESKRGPAYWRKLYTMPFQGEKHAIP
jgi:arylsulfatase A-like enzyme